MFHRQQYRSVPFECLWVSSKIKWVKAKVPCQTAASVPAQSSLLSAVGVCLTPLYQLMYLPSRCLGGSMPGSQSGLLAAEVMSLAACGARR